jgi:O-antigen ligase
MSIGSIIRVFFWLGVVHLAVSLAQFVMSGGVFRSFAFSGVALDDLAMILLPIGMALYLWTSKRTSLLYLAGTVIVLGGLIGTQSRAPIAIGVADTIFVMLVSWRRASDRQHGEPSNDLVHTRARRRIVGWLIVATGLIVTVIAVRPDFFFAVANRFSNLFTLDPARTFSFRLYLWGKALTAFAENPFVGIGPGMFRQIGEIYTTTHLHPVAFHLQGMTAHNTLLHYLAETGILGGMVVLAIVLGQFRVSRRVWFSSWRQKQTDVALAVYAVGFVFLISSLVEAGWMWGGQAGYIGCLLLVIVARAYRQAGRAGIR